MPSASAPHDDAHAAIRLRATASRLARRLRALAAADGPGAAKLGVLGQLYRLGPLSPTALAHGERVRLQTLTRLLAELDVERLVKRRADPTDARRTLLSLTPAGVRVLTADVRRREASLTAAIGAALSATDRARLVDACALIDRVADALDDRAADGVTADGRRIAA